MVQGKQTYIGQLEVLAFAAFLESVRCSEEAFRVKDRCAYAFIDNLSAKYGLQKGYSGKEDSSRIIHAFKLLQSQAVYNA